MKENNDDKLNLKNIMDFRVEKLNKIISSGINPYPNSFEKKHSISDILDDPKKYKSVKTAGRIVSIRKMGKSCFLNLQENKNKIQLYVSKDNLKEGLYDNLVRNLDIGDIVGLEGDVFYTKTNELSIKLINIELLAKNLYPLPNIKEKDGKSFFAFDDKESRYRNRYMDLIVNPQIQDVFIKRSKIINNLRLFLNNLDFLEVETPVLQPIYGGANARPFKTFHNSLDKDLYLRIADELYLKRLIIGGVDKVYEIAKNFRNEGMDRSHNPEFTMLEFYKSYSDVNDIMKITETMIRDVFIKVLDQNNFIFDDNTIDMKKDFEIISFSKSIKMFSDFEIIDKTEQELLDFIKKSKIKISKNESYGNLLDKIFSHFVEPNLINPTFVTDYPLVLSPLAKKSIKDPSKVDRFELFIGGMEIANAFSELNDPADQLNRLQAQSKLRELGDEEAQIVDLDFIKAMQVGMPPTGGVGIGIDRLTMLLTSNKSIKDVILFPAMR